MRREHLIPLLFALSLIVMPFVYKGLWYAHPDYFRIQQGVNVLPTELYAIAQAYSAYDNGPPLPPIVQPTEQDEYATKIVSTYKQFQSVSVMLATKQTELQRRTVATQAEYKSFEASMYSQIEQYVADKILKFQPDIKRLSSEMEYILRQEGVKNPDDLSSTAGIVYADLALQLAKTRLDMSKVEVDARGYALNHLEDFQRLPQQQEYVKHNKEVDALYKEVSGLRESTNDYHKQLYDALVAYRTAAEQTLGYWDFFYFSVGAATTATFGDIAPNSKFVRILVCIQVLGSILATGFTVSGLTKERARSS
jgi:hypothetical protein